MIKAVLFDVIGTTVLERDPSLINNCFVNAFADSGVAVSEQEIIVIRGKNKEEAIRDILSGNGHDESLTKAILNNFHRQVSSNLKNFRERDEFTDIMGFLRRRKILVGVGTGLSSGLFELIYDHLEWKRHQFDFIGVADELGVGRPDPKMLLMMMSKFNIQGDEFLKVGDTLSDIAEGKNARVKTAVLLAGTQSEAQLRKANPDYVIQSLSEIKTLLS